MGYLGFYAAAAVCMLLSVWASSRVKSTYAKYDKVRNRLGATGYDTAVRLLRMGGVTDISVGKVGGTLSDHYHPTKKVVNLSETTYSSASVAAVAVAAHEIGHVMQNKTGYLFYRIRTAIVPVVNIGSRLSFPLVLLGVFLEVYVSATQNSGIGFDLAMLGVILYGLSFLFALVTMPVELNASRRAEKLLLQSGIVNEAELPGVRKVLSAAAMTYLASLLTSLVYLLRFFFWVLSMFGRRRD
ncbi:MAG: zinc metallopeptidase [Oscillospiraceae bacterium]|nr:zinc metallopeptidase [Oscillospiraceae bacterium]